MQLEADDLIRQLFVNDTPLIDVRAPGEFAKGAFPCAINLPLLDDEQRHQVGICYKQEGKSEAICLGRQLVNGQQKAGTQQVVWSGKNHYGAQVGSGVYIYKIIAGDFAKSQTMVLVK